MKMKGLVYIAVAALAFSFAACGNSQKKREREEQRIERRMERQPQTDAVVETESVIVEVDTILPDTVMRQTTVRAPKRTK